MQEARDANGHRPRPCPCRPLPVALSAFPLQPAQFLPRVIRAVRVVAHGKRVQLAKWQSETESIRPDNANALPVHAFPKRSDGRKNVRNSSLSIAWER